MLAHGGRCNQESGEKQARTFAAAKFQGLALDFRVYAKVASPGQSDLPPYQRFGIGGSKHVLPTEPAKDAVFAEPYVTASGAD